MAWKRIFNNSSADNYARFICDAESDIATLPNELETSDANDDHRTCGIGSRAIVIETKEEWILNNENEWKILGSVTGGGGGGDFDIASINETKDFLNI